MTVMLLKIILLAIIVQNFHANALNVIFDDDDDEVTETYDNTDDGLNNGEQFEGPEDAYLPHERKCDLFYVLEGRDVMLLTCPKRQLFDVTTQKCAKEGTVNCGFRLKPKGKGGSSSEESSEEEESFKFRCPSRKGNYPHKHYCNLYYSCEKPKRHAQLQQCPTNTLFDIHSGVCKHRYVVDCESRIDPRDDPDDHEDKVIDRDPKFDCDKSHGKFTHEKYCHWYYNCQDKKATLKECSRGRYYDAYRRKCLHPKDVSCENRIKPEEPFKCYKEGKFPHERNCGQYYHCKKDLKLDIHQCPPKKLFNIYRANCEEERHVTCGDRIHPDDDPDEPEDKVVDPKPDFDCKESFGRYKHEKNCDWYFHCKDKLPTVRECRRGRYYDYRRGKCLDSREVDCEEREKPEDREKRTSTTVQSTTETTTETTVIPTTRAPFICPSKEGKYPDEFDCSVFHDCKKGKVKTHQCSSGYLYHIKKKKCVDEEDVECGSRIHPDDDPNEEQDKVVDPDPQFTCKDAHGKFTHDDFCDWYMHCKDKKPTTRECKKGKFYDAKKRKCRDFDKVDCGGRKKPEERTTTSATTSTAETSSVTTSSRSTVTPEPTKSESKSTSSGTSTNPSSRSTTTGSTHTQTSRSTVSGSSTASTTVTSSTISGSSRSTRTGSSTASTIVSTSTKSSSSSSRSPGTESSIASTKATASTPYISSSSESPRTGSTSSTATSSESPRTGSTGNSGSTGGTRSTQSESPTGTEEFTSTQSSSTEGLSTTTLPENITDPSICKELDGNFAHPKECSLFYNCKDGALSLLQCPDGTLFHSVIKLCYREDWVNCEDRKRPISGKTTTPGPTTTESSIKELCALEDGQFHHPTDCKQYYVCKDGMDELKECPQGTLFDNALRECYDEDHVNCGDRQRPPTTIHPCLLWLKTSTTATSPLTETPAPTTTEGLPNSSKTGTDSTEATGSTDSSTTDESDSTATGTGDDSTGSTVTGTGEDNTGSTGTGTGDDSNGSTGTGTGDSTGNTGTGTGDGSTGSTATATDDITASTVTGTGDDSTRSTGTGTGDDSTGSTVTGTGDDNTGSTETGTGDDGTDSTATGTGDDSTGSTGTGDDNTDTTETGTGDDGTGSTGTGDDNTGSTGTGDDNTGTTGTGTGDDGTGSTGTGDNNTGSTSTGDDNTGTTGTGTGDDSTGSTGTGTGDDSTGSTGTGDDSTDSIGTGTGGDNTGSTVTGTGDDNTGSTVTETGDDSTGSIPTGTGDAFVNSSTTTVTQTDNSDSTTSDSDNTGSTASNTDEVDFTGSSSVTTETTSGVTGDESDSTTGTNRTTDEETTPNDTTTTTIHPCLTYTPTTHKQHTPPHHHCDQHDLDCIIKETGDINEWFKCPEEFGIFPHPSSSMLFIHCSNNVPSPKKCAKGLVFSSEYLLCIVPGSEQ